MPTLPNMGLITPVPGADSGTWDDKINTSLATVDSHDHTSGKGVAITPAALDINDNIEMTSFGLLNTGQIDFTEVPDLTSGAQTLFVSSADGELYWRNDAGTNVQLTSGATINVSLASGIAGDYSSAGAEVAYDSANKLYTFKDESSPTKKWARVASGPLRMYEYNTTESVYLEHIIDPTLASSYTLIWPAALPATEPAHFRVNPSGLIEYTTDTAVERYSAFAFHEGGETHAHTYPSGNSIYLLGNSLDALHCPIALRTDDIVTEVTAYINKASDATNTLTLSVVTFDAATGLISATQTQTLATNAPGQTTMTLTLSPSISAEAGKSYIVQFQQSDATPSAVDKLFGVDVTITRA